MKKTKTFRELFRRDGPVRLVGAHDGLSAKLVEEGGFEGIWASGFEISASHAVPDANILSMTQYLERACEMNEATSIPVVADCDTGYGNSINAIHMVHKYEAAGIAGVCIEDKRFPKVNSYVAGRQDLAPIAEFVGKIMGCKHAQADPDFMVIARVEALIAGWGEQEALRRAHAYVDAGADAVLIHSKSRTPNEIRSFCRRWNRRAPLVIVPTTYPMLHLEEMEALGIKMVVYANHGLRAAVKAMSSVFEAIKRAGDLTTIADLVVPMEEVFRLQGVTQMKESEQRYVKEGLESISVIIPAAGDPTYEPSLRDILEACPVAMLDINGKPLLLRNRETLNACGISNITVVTGFHAERFDVDGVRYVENPSFRETRQIDSVLLADPYLGERVLVIFSDVIFDKSIIQKLRDSHDDIVLVIDSSMPRKRTDVDYVQAQAPPMPEGRSLTLGRPYRILQIGKNLDAEKANFEFTGIAYFSRRGFELLKQTYVDMKTRGHANADILTALQRLIDEGTKVSGLEVREGWIEIRTLENYKAAYSLFDEA